MNSCYRNCLSCKTLNIYCHCSLVAKSCCPTLCDPMDYSWPGSLCTWDFPCTNTGVGCHFLLHGIFLTQGSSPCLLYWQVGSLPLSHWGNPNIYYSVPLWKEFADPWYRLWLTMHTKKACWIRSRWDFQDSAQPMDILPFREHGAYLSVEWAQLSVNITSLENCLYLEGLYVQGNCQNGTLRL